jgi:hypothetical protein
MRRQTEHGSGRKLNNKTIYPDWKPTDLQHVTKYFFETPIDVDRLIQEMGIASTIDSFTKKDFPGWTSLALRSLRGITGDRASDAHGEHSSSDIELFADTPAMQPYIKEIISRVGGKGVLKVRLMKMKANSTVGEHRDNFRGDGVVVRFHIPIITHPKVVFFVNSKPYKLEAGQIYRVDVSQRHAVQNNSPIDRIHLVFDIVTDQAVTDKLAASAANKPI